MGEKEEKVLHIAMFPWFAFGHLYAFLQLANKLALRGHTITFFLPTNTHPKLASHNLHPHLLTFIPIAVPSVPGLPPGAETTADVPQSGLPLLMTAMDLTRPALDSSLARLRPDFILFDVAHWVPSLARKHRARPIFFMSTFVSSFAYLSPQARSLHGGAHIPSEADMERAPPGFPDSSSFRLRANEAREVAAGARMVVGLDGLPLLDKFLVGIRDCDAVCLKSCREMEGQYGDYFERHYGKPVVWAGLSLGEPPEPGLDDELEGWLKGFEEGSAVYCALGSERVLGLDQFQELVLGLELTGLPFLAALKPPMGHETIETALPQGFLERTRGRGIIKGGWVHQQLILKHSSIGCFVTHCGAGSLTEALASECQIVLLPQGGDQFFNARLMSRVLKVAVEVERREDDGFFTKEAVREAVMATMERESGVGKEVRDNHARWRELILSDGFEESYICGFIRKLQDMLE